MILTTPRDPRFITIRRGGGLTDDIRELVLDDQGLRNEACWSVFE